MELSVFLARVIGVNLLTLVLIMACRKKEAHTAFVEIFTSPGTLALSGTITLLIGILIVVSHPICEASWRGFITFLGALAIISGSLRIGFPIFTRRISIGLLERGGGVFAFLLMLLAGLYLIYHGFMS